MDELVTLLKRDYVALQNRVAELEGLLEEIQWAREHSNDAEMIVALRQFMPRIRSVLTASAARPAQSPAGGGTGAAAVDK